jgi:hypothetical protein
MDTEIITSEGTSTVLTKNVLKQLSLILAVTSNYHIFLNTLHHRISCTPHISRSKKLKNILNSVYWSNKVYMLSICKNMYFYLDAMFFINFRHYYMLCFWGHAPCNKTQLLPLSSIILRFVHQMGEKHAHAFQICVASHWTRMTANASQWLGFSSQSS